MPFGLTQGQISQISPFLIALGLEIFGLAFWLFFGLFGPFWPFPYEATIEVTECAPTPIFRYLYKAVKLLSNMKFVVIH